MLEWTCFQKKALASPLIVDIRFSRMVHMQASLESGSWSRERLPLPVSSQPHDKRFLSELHGEDSAT